jgi:hypothetical protein
MAVLVAGAFPSPALAAVREPLHRATVDDQGRPGTCPSTACTVTDLRLSPDGRVVFFKTDRGYDPADTGGADTYAHESSTGKTKLLPQAVSTAQMWMPFTSTDGRLIAFTSGDDRLVPDDTNSQPDVFVLDWHSGAVERASVGTDGGQLATPSSAAAVSGDGRFVVLATGGDNELVRDVERDVTYSVPVGSSDRIAADVRYRRSARASCGFRCQVVYVTYDRVTGQESTSVNAPPPDDAGYALIRDGEALAFDRGSGQATRASVPDSATTANGIDTLAALSADATTVAFASTSSNLVAGDTDGQVDVFTRRMVWLWPSQALKNVDGLCATAAPGARSTNGGHVELFGCSGPGQEWTVNSDGTLRADGKCLDATDGGTGNGTRIQLWDCHGGANQRWQLHADGTLVNPASRRCLDAVDGRIAENGTALQLWDCHGDPNQRWVLPPPTSAITGLAGKCLDAAGNAWRDGTAAQLYTCNQTAAQAWTASADGTIRGLGRCLDVRDADRSNGTRVQLWSCNGTSAQQWLARSDGTLINPASGRCLDVTDADAADGTPLQLWDCHGGVNQRWQLPKPH